jgi:5-methylcytosine-specific restriction endonuclease McrBC GTP-binding regulatory subunit McrB
MNLAHAELYFAEFLSKLELRRGAKGDPPRLEVKLGTGMFYELPLGRNVLWTGTMNQDETTKSLSDKVLDRSIVIHFPRPLLLERRRELKPLPAPAPLLHRKTWEGWWARGSKFSDEQIAPFKRVIEEINAAMSRVGRALGHRVWQSVEYYMANYPDTMAAQRAGDAAGLDQAMRLAFQDQLVQKVMPKLRGIETRGRSKAECLDKVRALLVDGEYGIVDDFDLSCEFGYGQFIWQTSSFLQERAPALDAAGAPAVAEDGPAAPEGKPQ